MISIGIATAAAGVNVGTVTLTGVGLVMTELVETISGGNIVIMLFMVCLHLPDPGHRPADHRQLHHRVHPDGAGDRRGRGAERPLVPLIAVHLFVFYFGLMADVTLSGGLASLRRGGDRLERSDKDRGHRVYVFDPHGGAALHVHLQHAVVADRHRGTASPHADTE